MAAQSVISFPCRKSRVLSPKTNILNSFSDQKTENSPKKRAHQSAALGCSRSIMPQPKSPRKHFVESTTTTAGWSNEDILSEIFKLSPCSPVKNKENFSCKDQNLIESPKRKALLDKNALISPTRSILSPIRSLSLNSPEKFDLDVEAKRSKILQLKLERVKITKGRSTVKLPHDETPTKPLTPKARTTQRQLVEETPQKEDSPVRRVTRSSKKNRKQKKLTYDVEDDFKENIPPGTIISPTKKQKTSIQSEDPTSTSVKSASPVKANVVRALDVNSPKKTCSPRKLEHVSELLSLRTSPRKTPKKNVCEVKELRMSPRKLSSPRKLFVESGVVSRSSPRKLSKTSPVKRILQLQAPNAVLYQKTKRALHSSLPDQLVGREQEMKKISSFIRSGIDCQNGKSLYISGPPGTGKSACLAKVLSDEKVIQDSTVISVNCMSMRNATVIYSKIASELGAQPSKCKSMKSSMKYLATTLTSDGPPVILLLDEMDQLDSKNQEVLYTIFEWPALTGSRLLLIGIANALDLTDRILPRLQSRKNCQPVLLNFRPYSKDQIVSILEERVKMSPLDNERVIEPMAIQFCARKVSAVAGDARKALDICRRAVEIVETNVKSQQVLSTSGKIGDPKVAHKVGLKEIAGVLSEVYESSIGNKKAVSSGQSQPDNEESFPLQQRIAICTLILLSRYIKCKEVTLGKLHDSYAKICKKRQVTAVGHSEFSALLQLIETRGIVTTKAGKQMRMTKVMLALQEKDVEYALRDKTLLSSILQEGLPK